MCFKFGFSRVKIFGILLGLLENAARKKRGDRVCLHLDVTRHPEKTEAALAILQAAEMELKLRAAAGRGDLDAADNLVCVCVCVCERESVSE